MSKTRVFALLLIGIMFLPTIFSIPSPRLSDTTQTMLDPNFNQEGALQVGITNPTHDIVAQPANNLPVELPEIPSSISGNGASRPACLFWNTTDNWYDRNQTSDVQVTLGEGELYRELLQFSQIVGHNLTSIIEEDVGWYFEPGVDEPIFMGFQINGTDPVRLDGFWMELYDKTNGLINYAVYAAEPGAFPYAQPNISAPIVPPTQITVAPLPDFTGVWIWFEVDQSLAVLDPALTYNSTFFVAIWRSLPQDKLQVLGIDDTDLYGYPTDYDDEGDAYLSWSLSYQDVDYLLKVSIYPFTRYQLPSALNMAVNGSAVIDGVLLGYGQWENWPVPRIVAPGATRYYDVSLSWSGYYQFPVTFNVGWLGSYLNMTYANATFQVWTNQDATTWDLNTTATFPSDMKMAFIQISIEEDWDVIYVHYEESNLTGRSPHLLWEEFPDYVQINNAENGSWFVHCKAPNYIVDVEVRDALDQVITETTANNTVVTTRGYVQDEFGTNATNGMGYLRVYDPETLMNYENLQAMPMPPGGIVDLPWPIWWTATEPGYYTLQVAWSNGTEAGMGETWLLVWFDTILVVQEEFPDPGGDVARGQLVELVVFYGDYLGNPLTFAEVSVINDTSGWEWQDWSFENLEEYGYPGWYYIALTTDYGQIGVRHNVTITMWQDLYVEQAYAKNFTIIVGVYQIQPMEGFGVSNSSGVWRTAPEPLINQTGLQFTVNLTANDGTPLPYAFLEPVLRWGTKSKLLSWMDLYARGFGPAGLYNITIDTTPIGGQAFHVGDEPYIIIRGLKEGFEPVLSPLIFVRPQPRHFYLDVPVEYQQINVYENWTYSVPLRVVLRDLFTTEDLSFGTVTAVIPGQGNITMDLATPGLGLYEITSLDTQGIPSGSHNVMLYAEANDYISCNTTVNFNVMPKKAIQHHTEILEPSNPNHGKSVQLTVTFSVEDVLASKDGYKQASEPLPRGTEVILEIVASFGASPAPVAKYLDGTGSFTHSFLLENDGAIYSFFVTIAEDEEYIGLARVSLTNSGIPINIPVTSLTSMILGYLPWIVAAILLVSGSVLSYRQFRIVPRRRARLQKLQKIADTFSDVVNLNRLLVLHKESGICVFDPFAEESQDATLVAGFLQAISTFGHDLADTPGMTNGEQDGASTLRELTYEGFRILIHDGQFVRNALVLSGTPSEQLRERLEQFTIQFEKRYQKDFDHWSGRVDQFNSASDLVEEIFLVSLRLPHRVRPRKPRKVSLTSLENDLHKLAKELTTDREYIFLGQILSTYIAATKRDKLEVLMAIYQLRMKGVLLPWRLEAAITVSNKAGDAKAA